jgi:hypothetical protein
LFLLGKIKARLVANSLYFFPLHFLDVAMAQAGEGREQGGAF